MKAIDKEGVEWLVEMDVLQPKQKTTRIMTKKQPLIPSDAHSFEVFAIKDCDESPTGKQAFVGFKISNGDFHFIGVPYTPNKNQEQ